MANKYNVYGIPGISDNADDNDLVYAPIRGYTGTTFGMVRVGELRRDYKRKQQQTETKGESK